MDKFFIAGSIIIALFFLNFIFQPFNKIETKVITETKKVEYTQDIITTLPSSSEKIEVIAFHSNQRCTSCINISKYTKSVIEEKFPNQLNAGKIIFKEINIDLAENKQIANDFEVSGSTLYLKAIKDNKEYKEVDTTVWRLVTNEAMLKAYFEAKLKKLL